MTLKDLKIGETFRTAQINKEDVWKLAQEIEWHNNISNGMTIDLEQEEWQWVDVGVLNFVKQFGDDWTKAFKEGI